MSTDRISLYDQSGIDRLRRQQRIDPRCMRQLRTRLLKHFESDEVVWEAMRSQGQGAWLDRLGLHSLEFYQRRDSSLDGATKLLLRTARGMLLETVLLRIATGRTTLCVSSQVGCAAACDFCATGKMGLAHNLSAEEILDQVLRAGQLLAAEDRRLKNIVFMGMGEPFHNEEHLHRALAALTAPELFHHSPRKVLVSTVGIPEAMVRCARRFPEVNLALSLHSVRPAVRERLIPLAKKYPLEALRGALAALNRVQRVPVMIEYLMLAGINDSLEDARELIAWLDGLRVHVNLIPYNAIDDAPHWQGSDRPTRDVFAGLLKQAGMTTTIRYSLGADIAAACGQLVRRENRQVASTLR